MKKAGVLLLAGLLLLGMTSGDTWAERSGGTFNFLAPYGGSLSSLDPHTSARTQDAIVNMALHRPLYVWDTEQSKPVLELADSVDVSEDGLVYTYHLKNNAKFHNGRTMTADDIIWSYERAMSPEKAYPPARFVRIIKGAKAREAGEAEHIEGLRKIDDFTLEMTLEEMVDPGYSLFEPVTSILPREEVEAKGDEFAAAPVGLGPFKFAKWVRGSELVVEKFPDFYKEGKPYLDKVVYKIMGEAAARDLAFRAKELDATILSADQYQVYSNDPELSKYIVEVAEMYTRHLGFHPDFEPLKDKRVRQAFNYAINTALIIEKLVKGKAFAAVGWQPSTSPAFDPNAKGYEYNPEKAKELLKEAGYEEGFELEVLTTDSMSYGIAILEAIMPFLQKVGITLKPKLTDNAVFQELVYEKGEFDAYIMSFNSGPDPIVTAKRWHSETPRGTGNYISYNNPEYDKLVDAAVQERDYAKQMDYLRQADALFREDAPIWFFNYNKAVMAYQPWVHGIQANAVELMYQDPESIWIDESSPRANEK